MQNLRSYRGIPVVLATLLHTGLKDGNDGKSGSKLGIGYRDVKFASEDNVEGGNPDELVALNDKFVCHPIYANGGEQTESIYYKDDRGPTSIFETRQLPKSSRNVQR